MDLTLKRVTLGSSGIFGQLLDEKKGLVCVTLEHAFKTSSGLYVPLIPPGTYLCTRGMHRLAQHWNPFETFEVQGVLHHTGILFHKGNVNSDSEGCILLGTKLGKACLVQSTEAFEKFLWLERDVDHFSLEVEAG